MSSNQSDASLLGKIAGYTEILAKDPNSTIFVPLCEAYRQMGLLDDALDIALKGVKALPMFSPGYTALGRIQAQRGALEEAAASFEKALEMDGESLAALKGLARLRLQTGEKDRARELLQRVAALEPDDAAVQKMLAKLEAEPISPGPVEAPPHVSPPASSAEPISTPTIAELYIRQGFPQRAMKVYRDLLKNDPNNDEIRQKLVALKKRVDAEEAPAAAGKTVEQAQTPASGTTEIPGANGYSEVLSRWLDSIRKRREHVQ